MKSGGNTRDGSPSVAEISFAKCLLPAAIISKKHLDVSASRPEEKSGGIQGWIFFWKTNISSSGV